MRGANKIIKVIAAHDLYCIVSCCHSVKLCALAAWVSDRNSITFCYANGFWFGCFSLKMFYKYSSKKSNKMHQIHVMAK